MSESGEPRAHAHRGRTVAIAIAVALLVALVACAAVVGVSLKRSVDDLAGQVSAASEAGDRLSDDVSSIIPDITESVRSLDLSGLSAVSADAQDARAAAQELSDAVGAIEGGLDAWPWRVAAALPVLGSDVTFARDLVGNADALVDTLPALADDLDEVVNGNAVASGTLDLGAIRDDVDNARDLVGALEATRGAAAASERAIRAMPDAHIGRLNDARDSLAASIGKVNAAFADHADELDAASQLASAL